MSRRDLPIDTLRGFACILLVTMHVIGSDTASGIHVPEDSVYRWYADSFTYLRMPLFSFISGYVYAWWPLASPSGYGGFMVKKMRRLLVPYIIFVPAIGLTQLIAPGVNRSTQLRPLDWLVYSLSPYWFLLATFWIFAVVALLDSFKVLKSLSAGVAAVAVLAVANILVRDSWGSFLQVGNALSLSTFFVAGLVVFRHRLFDRSRWLLVGVGVCVLAALTYTQLGIFGVIGETTPRYDLVGIIVGIGFPIIVLGLHIKIHWLAWIGVYSAGIFLLHPFFAAGTRVLLQQFGATDLLLQFVVASLVGILGSIGGVVLLRRVAVGRVILGESARRTKSKRAAVAERMDPV